LKLRFWGTRGSIATPGPATNRFGGNTSCVELLTKAGQRFIIDCGTGARLLGMHMMEHAPKPIRAAILISHTHWDHIQGFPFFAPAFVPGGHITVCGPAGGNNSLRNTLSGQMEYAYFPVQLGDLGARLDYRELPEGENEIGGVRIVTQRLNHLSATLGYRVEADGVSVMYVCDHEPYWEPLWHSNAPPGRLSSILHAGDRRHAEFLLNADVVIHDAQYTPEEYPAKKNWGHSTYRYVTEIAAAAKVKRLFLTHHDPTHDDEFLTRTAEQAQAIAQAAGSPMRVSVAREGFEETFEGDGSGHAQLDRSNVTPASDGRPPRILMVDDDEDILILARKALSGGWNVILEAGGGNEAMQLIQSEKPDLVVLDLLMPSPDGREVLRWMRENERTRGIPVLVLTAQGDEDSIRTCFDLGATDYLVKPFTAPQINVRVRYSLARAGR
jgi:phosphoribosyl 1,2-cyclic phosphodiesterase/CheY-like chemotaxis protein